MSIPYTLNGAQLLLAKILEWLIEMDMLLFTKYWLKCSSQCTLNSPRIAYNFCSKLDDMIPLCFSYLADIFLLLTAYEALDTRQVVDYYDF